MKISEIFMFAELYVKTFRMAIQGGKGTRLLRHVHNPTGPAAEWMEIQKLRQSLHNDHQCVTLGVI